MGLCLQQWAYSISSWVTGLLLFTLWINSWQTQSLSGPNFSQKTKGFKINSWFQIKQQYLTILCFFFPLVCRLSSQYFNMFPRGLSEGILLVGLSLCCLYFPFPLLVGSFLHSDSPSLWQHPLWELETLLGGCWVSLKLLTWIRFKTLILPYTVWGHFGTVDQDSTFPSCHLTHLFHTLHSLQYPNHKDIAWSLPRCILSWSVYKLALSLWYLSSELFYTCCE
jgi:hypothetical protein